jgi:hypothetical protein
MQCSQLDRHCYIIQRFTFQCPECVQMIYYSSFWRLRKEHHTWCISGYLWGGHVRVAISQV